MSELKKMNILRYQDYDTLQLNNEGYQETDEEFIEDINNIALLR